MCATKIQFIIIVHKQQQKVGIYAYMYGKKRKRKALSLNAGIFFQLDISKGMAETTVQYQITPYFQY